MFLETLHCTAEGLPRQRSSPRPPAPRVNRHYVSQVNTAKDRQQDLWSGTSIGADIDTD